MSDRSWVKAGLERANAQGKVLGRPKMSKAVERKFLKFRKQGKGMMKIAKEVGCGTGTVQRVIRQLPA